MKNIKSKLAIALLSLALCGCNDSFMDRKPLDTLTDYYFWHTENDLKSYCNNLYTLLPQSDPFGDNWSDNQVPTVKIDYLFDLYTVPNSAGDAGWNWGDIRSCNYFLQRYNQANVSRQIKNKYVGEVKFFRALLYSNKVIRFGDVPWYGKDLNTSDLAELNKARDSRKLVMDSVLNDLDYAIANLPLPEDAETGRINKYVAAALKARICLFEGTYRKYHNLGDEIKFLNEAASAAELVMNSGKYSIYKTGNPNSDYYNLFVQDELQGNPEAILPMRYIKDLKTQNLTRQLDEFGSGFSKDFVESALFSDGKPISLHPEYTDISANKWDIEFSNRDPRLKQMIATQRYVLFNDGDTITRPRISSNSCSTGYRIIKFASSDRTQWNFALSTLDVFIFRYAETLLIEAEAKAELGACDQTVLDKTINVLRNRVNMAHLDANVGFIDVNWPGWGYSVSPLLNEIRRERRIELAAEGFRFNDLLRWKAGSLINNPKTIVGLKLDPSLQANYSGTEFTSDNNVKVYPGNVTRAWKDRMYLYPLPTGEISLNSNLTQNPGW
ncbi:MAG: RagB/SusD family nutrient uptake outer membrane protein [Paludibacter sp.]|nr:RagB/SusD family nutrient uptake outer membrane protein [Paludibacter sp.]